MFVGIGVMANVSKLNSLWNRWLRLSAKLHVALLLLRWRCSLWHHLMAVEMLLFTITVTYKALPPTIHKNKHGGHDFTSFQFSILGLPWGSPPGWTCMQKNPPPPQGHIREASRPKAFSMQSSRGSDLVSSSSYVSGSGQPTDQFSTIFYLFILFFCD